MLILNFLRTLKYISAKFDKLLTILNTSYYRRMIRKSGGFFGENVVIGKNVVISGLGNISLGDNVSIGANSFIRADGGLTIGDNTIISRDLILYTTSHNYEGTRLPFDDDFINNPVVIEKNCWIGMQVTISPGTTIGEGAIVGLGTRVYGCIEKLSIIGSSSPKGIKFRNKEHYDRFK